MKESSYKRDVTCRRQQPEDKKPSNRSAAINLHRNVFALKKSQGSPRGSAGRPEETNRPTDRLTERWQRLPTFSSDFVFEVSSLMASVSRPHEGASLARLTVARPLKSVDGEGEREPGRRSGRVIFFSSVELPGEADWASLAMLVRQSILSIKSSLPTEVGLLLSFPNNSNLSLSLSLSPSIRLILSFSMRRFILLSRSQPHAYTRIHDRSEPVEVHARANPRIPRLVGGSGWSASWRPHLVRQDLWRRCIDVEDDTGGWRYILYTYTSYVYTCCGNRVVFSQRRTTYVAGADQRWTRPAWSG